MLESVLDAYSFRSAIASLPKELSSERVKSPVSENQVPTKVSVSSSFTDIAGDSLVSLLSGLALGLVGGGSSLPAAACDSA